MNHFRAGEPVWIDLTTRDPEKAESFYTGLFGWTVRHEALGKSVYRMCSLEGRDVAGISDSSLHGTQQTGWVTYFAVSDIDRAVQQASALGGQLVWGPRYLPDAGNSATMIDPFGAMFGLFQGESRLGVETLNATGSLCWNELDTGELSESVSYYESLFGFGTEQLRSPHGRPYTVLTVEGQPVAGVLELDNQWPNVVPATWITYFSVSSLDEAVRKTVDLGGTASIGPVDGPHGRLQLVHDPGGHTLCLIELSQELRTVQPHTAEAQS